MNTTNQDPSGRFGVHLLSPKGLYIQGGESKYSHNFGGSSWAIRSGVAGPERLAGLILTLDLRDSRLRAFTSELSNELPLCSYLNCTLWEKRQSYRFDYVSRKVFFDLPSVNKFERAEQEDCLPLPLPETRMKLVDLVSDAYPTDYEAYERQIEDMLGGQTIARLLNPLWSQEAISEMCECGKPMIFTACIGYEGWGVESGLAGVGPFFIGEVMLYFFLCKSCCKIHVISQPA